MPRTEGMAEGSHKDIRPLEPHQAGRGVCFCILLVNASHDGVGTSVTVNCVAMVNV